MVYAVTVVEVCPVGATFRALSGHSQGIVTIVTTVTRDSRDFYLNLVPPGCFSSRVSRKASVSHDTIRVECSR
jgi:hypothetical protein